MEHNWVNITEFGLVDKNFIKEVKLLKKKKRKTSIQYECSVVMVNDREFSFYFTNIDLVNNNAEGRYNWVLEYLNKEDLE